MTAEGVGTVKEVGRFPWLNLRSLGWRKEVKWKSQHSD